MKLKNLTTVTILTLAVLSTACKQEEAPKDSISHSDVESTRDMIVPNGFNFNTDKVIQYNFNLDQAPLSGKYKIEIYDFVPEANEGFIQSSFVAQGTSISGSVKVASHITQLYVKMYSPEGSSFLTILPINGTSISHTFYQTKTYQKSGLVSPDCVSGCDYNVTHTNSWWDADDKDDVYCVTGTYSGGGITVKDKAIVRLCGTGNIQNLVVDKDAEVIVTTGADVTISYLDLKDKADLVVHQGATLTITGWFTVEGDIINEGTINMTDMTIKEKSDIENYSIMAATGNSWSSCDGNIENYGTFSVAADFELKDDADIENYCTFTIGGQFYVNGDFDNESYIQVDDQTSIYSKGDLIFHDGAIGYFEDFWLNSGAKVEGKGSTSILKVSGISTSWSDGQIKGNLEYCDADGIENFGSNTIKSGAVEACNLVVNTSSCILQGNGVPTIVDTDGDGVSDELDAYPNDASKAAHSFYPSEGVFGTLAFEDLWPTYGDYDFNDLVVDYNYKTIVDANNDVVDVEAKFVTKAIGGSFLNGFGIQMDVASSAVASVTGSVYSEGIISNAANGTESGQSKATIIVYDNAYNILPNVGGSFVNTTNGNPYSTPDTMDINIAFSSPQSAIGSAPFNPFIFVDGTRGREVHLAGEQPTDLADNSYFQRQNDNTTVGSESTYKSTRGLPWAINLTSGFSYPEEKVDIVQAYQYFDNWAQSGGLSNTDWYQDITGYVDNTKLYTAQ